MVNLNLDGVASGFEPIPAGTYVALITKAEEITSSQKGTPGINFAYTIQEGEFNGRVVFDTCYLTPKALFRLKNVLAAVDYDIPAGDFNFVPDEVVGKYVVINVTLDPHYSGEDDRFENNVKGVAKYKRSRG